jgi:hypothetical protein
VDWLVEVPELIGSGDNKVGMILLTLSRTVNCEYPVTLTFFSSLFADLRLLSLSWLPMLLPQPDGSSNSWAIPFIAAVLDDLAHMHRRSLELQRVVRSRIRWKPVASIHLLPVRYKRWPQI